MKTTFVVVLCLALSVTASVLPLQDSAIAHSEPTVRDSHGHDHGDDHREDIHPSCTDDGHVHVCCQTATATGITHNACECDLLSGTVVTTLPVGMDVCPTGETNFLPIEVRASVRDVALSESALSARDMHDDDHDHDHTDDVIHEDCRHAGHVHVCCMGPQRPGLTHNACECTEVIKGTVVLVGERCPNGETDFLPTN